MRRPSWALHSVYCVLASRYNDIKIGLLGAADL